MMAAVAGGPCVCIASSRRRPSVSASPQDCHQVGYCRVPEAVGTASAALVRKCQNFQAVVRLEASGCPFPAAYCGTCYSGPWTVICRQALWRNKAGSEDNQRIHCTVVSLPRIPSEKVGLVNTTSEVLVDYRFVLHSLDKPSVSSTSYGRGRTRILNFKARRQRSCAAALCSSWASSNLRKARTGVRAKGCRLRSSAGHSLEKITYFCHQVFKFGLANLVEDGISLVSSPCFGLRIADGHSDSRLKGSTSSRRSCRGDRGGSSRFYYQSVGRSKSVQAAGNGQYDVSSEGRDVRATRTRNDGKLVGELVGESQPLTDAEDAVENARDIATVALSATIAAEISTNELVEATEAARLSRALQTSSYQDTTTGLPTDETQDGSALDGELQVERLLRKLATLQEADSVLARISEAVGGAGRVLSNRECSGLILAALAENNVDLAYSILNAMRCSLLMRRLDCDEGTRSEGEESRWRWPQADVTTYAALVRGLAASLRVSDALQTVADVRRRGIPSGDEVPFGKVVTCPTCKTALAVVQPQHGIQLVPCAKCRYQYELMSGDVVSCECESVSGDVSIFERGLRVLQLVKQPIASAVHSIVVRTPDGLARTHKFATASADLAAQEGERVTVALAAPVSAGRGIGPLKISTRAPGWRPSEPMAITNHATGRVANLIRAPPKSGSGASFDTSVIVPAAVLLASSDAASALIDPTLPRAIAVGAAAAVALGGAANAFVLPRFNQLPQRAVDVMALRQQLLAQHERLQERLEDLTSAAAEEVRMLARMCQLQNKMEAVGESTYSARIARVQKARDGLDERLSARLELIDSYAKIASMIEIEVEMDMDVLAAEAAGAAASIAEQIERLMEVESLQQEWKNQAEAGDEVERLLRSSPMLPEST